MFLTVTTVTVNNRQSAGDDGVQHTQRPGSVYAAMPSILLATGSLPGAACSQKERSWIGVVMILPQVHLRKPCYDFTFL